MEEVAKKLLYCVRMMNLIKWFSQAGSNDYRKRIISRSIFVYLDAFFNFAPQLKNTLEKKNINVKTIHEKISKIRDEYDSYHARIRDKLAAHRQDLPILELFEVWNEIDTTTLDYFISESLDIYNLLHALKREEIEPYSDFPITFLTIKPASVNIPAAPVTLTSDNLALTRPNTVSFIPINDFQVRGSQINSIIEIIYYLGTMYPEDTQGKDFERLVKSILIVDVINLIDNIYPHTPTDVRYKIESFLEILQKHRLGGQAILEKLSIKRDVSLEGKIRGVRNKICAHVDDSDDLSHLFDLLDTLPIDDLNKVFIPAVDAFYKACNADFRTRLLLMNNMASGSDVIGTADTGFVEEFEK
jgi:hypothetical protein